MKTFRILLVVSTALPTANFALAQTWMLTSAPSNHWESVASSADGTKLVAATSNGGIWASTNSGATWTQTSAPGSGWVAVASSADGNKLVAIGKAPLFSSTNPIYTSTNSGVAWTSNNVPNQTWCSVASSADGCKLVVVAALAFQPVICTSTNSGNTWVTNNAPGGACSWVASSADGTRLVVVSWPGIYISTNSGSSWTVTNSLSYAAICVASSVDGTRLVAVGGPRIFISTNFGMTWTQTSAPETNWISVASSADGSRLVAVAGGSHSLRPPVIVTSPIYTSTNCGVTWVSNSVPMQYWISAASSADGRKLVAVVSGGGIYTSQSTPEPQLNIKPASNNLALSWIVPSTNFVLQQSSDLGSWTDETNTPVLNLTNLQNEVILSPTNSSGFYRLKTP